LGEGVEFGPFNDGVTSKVLLSAPYSVDLPFLMTSNIAIGGIALLLRM